MKTYELTITVTGEDVLPIGTAFNGKQGTVCVRDTKYEFTNIKELTIREVRNVYSCNYPDHER